MHLTAELYRLLRRGVLEPADLAAVARGHAVERCDRCRVEWERVRTELDDADRDAASSRTGRGGSAPPQRFTVPAPPEDPDTLSVADLGSWKELLSRMRHETRKARQDVAELMTLPPETWEARVAGATSRFSSRAVARQLLVRCRREVRSDPRLAARLARLVQAVLHRLPRADVEPWGMELTLRAEAYRANAERVAGDLPAAVRRFAFVRGIQARVPRLDDGVAAEIDSLEASLCIDRRRFAEGERLLRDAIAGAARSQHRRVLRHALLKMAGIQCLDHHPERALATLDAAAREIGSDDDKTYEHACLLSCRLMALCDLERYAEAERLLAEAGPVLDLLPHSGAYLDGIRGRVALGMERWQEAAERFRSARAILLDLGRDYDAALTCLDLAHALLGAGDTAALRELATGLVPLFRSRGVERETLAVLRLLAEAVARDRADVALLGRLRRRLYRVTR